MKEIMDKELLKRYFENNCSPDEVNEIFKWLGEEALSLSDHNTIYQLWNGFSPEVKYEEKQQFDRILDKIHHQINLLQPGNHRGQKKETHRQLFHFIGRMLTRVAAILFLPLLACLIYTWTTPEPRIARQKYQENDTIKIMSPVGSRTFIQLSDGTGVHLNHGSSLKYPREFRGNNRIVELTGEAFFSVVHNPLKPFVVRTGNLNIAALGTEFNVMAYKGDEFVETTLVDGKIVVTKEKSDGTLQKVCEMKPDQYLKISLKSNTYKCEMVDPSRYVSWKDGVLIFKNDALEEITSRLGRWYNVEIIFRNEAVKEFSYTATFVDETLPQILDLLSLATPIKYEMTSRIKLPDGSFTKPKIFIDLKKN